MLGILADINIQGHWRLMLAQLEGKPWGEFWVSLNLTIHTFASLDLENDAADQIIWRKCQQNQVVFLTANRREQEVDSLETTIRLENTPESLPVITLANPRRVLNGKAYAARTVKALIERLLDIENYRGAGRIYIP